MVLHAGTYQAVVQGRVLLLQVCLRDCLVKSICSSHLLGLANVGHSASDEARRLSSCSEPSSSSSVASSPFTSCTAWSRRQQQALQHQDRQSSFGPSTAPQLQQQQVRGFAAKGKGRAAVIAPPAAPKAPRADDPYAPPEFRLRRVPQSVKGNVLDRLTAPQKALLQQLNPSSAPLRSLRQLGWPLGSKQLLGLLHDQLGEAAGTNVQVMPFVLEGTFQSATTLANVVKDSLEEGRGMPQVEQLLLTTIANLPPSEVTFEGIKVQVKGRMSGKGGMTTKRVWHWGRTSTANLSDPVDYAHEAVITRAGYVGIKVWIRYKRSVMQPQVQHSVRAAVTVPQLLAEAAPVTLHSRSSSAWWNTPGPLQPRQHRTWECFQRQYDPLTASLASLHQQPEQQQQRVLSNGDTHPPITEGVNQ